MPTITLNNIKNAFKNNVFRIYLEFLDYVLDITCKMNLHFQSNDIRIHRLHSTMTGFYVSFLRNFLKKSYVDVHLNDVSKVVVNNPDNYRQINEIYFGPKVKIFCEKHAVDEKDLKDFQLRSLDFYVQLCLQIKKRFTFNTVIEKLSLLDPVLICDQQFDSIVPLANEFPNIVTDMYGLDYEYRQVMNIPVLSTLQQDVEKYWTGVCDMRNGTKEFMFPNLRTFVKAMFSLPHSTAEVERVFSKLNLIKTRLRNRLHVSTCEAIILSKDLLKDSGGVCYKFKMTKPVGPLAEHEHENYGDDEEHLLLELFD